MPQRPKLYRPHKRRGSRSVAGRQHHKLYDTQAWRRASAAFLASNPYCVDCEAVGITRGAEVTDHIVPHKGDERLFWDSSNWQGLCAVHHNAKSARE